MFEIGRSGHIRLNNFLRNFRFLCISVRNSEILRIQKDNFHSGDRHYFRNTKECHLDLEKKDDFINILF